MPEQIEQELRAAVISCTGMIGWHSANCDKPEPCSTAARIFAEAEGAT